MARIFTKLKVVSMRACTLVSACPHLLCHCQGMRLGQITGPGPLFAAHYHRGLSQSGPVCSSLTLCRQQLLVLACLHALSPQLQGAAALMSEAEAGTLINTLDPQGRGQHLSYKAMINALTDYFEDWQTRFPQVKLVQRALLHLTLASSKRCTGVGQGAGCANVSSALAHSHCSTYFGTTERKAIVNRDCNTMTCHLHSQRCQRLSGCSVETHCTLVEDGHMQIRAWWLPGHACAIACTKANDLLSSLTVL